jgi:hypothetical protein
LEHDQAVHIPSVVDKEMLEARNQQEAPSVEDKVEEPFVVAEPSAVEDIPVELGKVDSLEMELDKAEE